MPDCACDAFTSGFIPSAAAEARPPSWRPLAEDPQARFAGDLSCWRGKDLVLARCTRCHRRFCLTWDQQNDTYAVSPVEPELLALLNLDSSPERLAAFLRSPSYRAWGHAWGDLVDRYLFEATYDFTAAVAALERARASPDLAPHVRSSIEVRLERVRRRVADAQRAARSAAKRAR
ncbi:MAG: hypothetical protein K1X89_26810 [Myxococcaceae bacterium]|nr:hypothetical protein [Myxococcaceae bacterium]